MLEQVSILFLTAESVTSIARLEYISKFYSIFSKKKTNNFVEKCLKTFSFLLKDSRVFFSKIIHEQNSKEV